MEAIHSESDERTQGVVPSDVCLTYVCVIRSVVHRL